MTNCASRQWRDKMFQENDQAKKAVTNVDHLPLTGVPAMASREGTPLLRTNLDAAYVAAQKKKPCAILPLIAKITPIVQHAALTLTAAPENTPQSKKIMQEFGNMKPAVNSALDTCKENNAPKVVIDYNGEVPWELKSSAQTYQSLVKNIQQKQRELAEEIRVLHEHGKDLWEKSKEFAKLDENTTAYHYNPQQNFLSKVDPVCEDCEARKTIAGGVDNIESLQKEPE